MSALGPADLPPPPPVGETSFLRHPEQLAALVELLPSLEQGGPLLLWSAGCASGEEAYGLALLLQEAGRRGDRIIATDVAEDLLAVARAGRYGPWTLRRVEAARRERWFRPAGAELEVVPALRDAVEFRRHDLVAEPPPWSFDAVLCRNVLLYFTATEARALAARMLAAVRPGGLLVLGPVELPLADGLDAERVRVGRATLLRRPLR